MQAFLAACWWTFLRGMLTLRYRVTLRGADVLQKLEGPTLVLPNHPAYVDPAIVQSYVRGKVPFRPLVFQSTYRNPAFYPLMKLTQAVEVRDVSEHSRLAREQSFGIIDQVAAGVARGESFLLYPAGQLERRGIEIIGGNRATYEILQRCPTANVVLVRTTGLWGSMFGFAQTGELPSLVTCLVRGLGWMAASLFFFLPRRPVTVDIELIERSRLPMQSRTDLNSFLEAWYNRGTSTIPVFVPYHQWFGPRTFNYPALGGAVSGDVTAVPPATRTAVLEMLAETLHRPLDDDERDPAITLDTLGLDSLDRMDLALALEDRFGFRTDQVPTTLGGLFLLAAGKGTAPQAADPTVAREWQRLPQDAHASILGDTVPDAFVRRVCANPDDPAAADLNSGVLTYRKLLMGARLLAKRFARLEEPRVGVLLPASVAADMTFLALHLTGKTPVMFNWTIGPSALGHGVTATGVKHVITSRKLVDRLHVVVPGAEFIFLEDLKQGIGKLEKLMALARSYRGAAAQLRDLPRTEPDSHAVILFTSGSESLPKAVPLTHRNLITNVSAAMSVLQLTRRDRLLGFLPPFHSFGLTGTSVMPLLSGLPVVHHADPTDARGLVRVIRAYRPTILFSTPTFLANILQFSTKEDLQSLRVCMTGAEKFQEALRQRVQELAPHVFISEAYGITECSPGVAGVRIGAPREGSIGQTLEGVTVCVVHHETGAPLPAGETGMLLVRGPSVFPGYLNDTGPGPFVMHAGERWYRTGDLVSVDADGYLFFHGRLKRFLKAAGEMISLPALEAPLAAIYPPGENGPQVAVEGIESPSGRHIVLFTTVPLTLREANDCLSKAGLKGVMRFDEVRSMDSIPVLGTGKTDYRSLRELVQTRTTPPTTPETTVVAATRASA